MTTFDLAISIIIIIWIGLVAITYFIVYYESEKIRNRKQKGI